VSKRKSFPQPAAGRQAGALERESKSKAETINKLRFKHDKTSANYL